MGLDMYAYTIVQQPLQSVDFDPDEPRELHYWRKHPKLHGWMEVLYRTKGGAEQDFNCVNLQLTREDLDRLEIAIRSGALPDTTGFFFGESDGSETADDLRFVANAREALAAGLTVFYSSWW
ncbi:hypothetical protein [Sinorhizobium meliloti]|uniref:hypothetical protein n=1 Tax=Rhizobium meliloti TaxID=382 RepID=UPI000317C6E5|nr:hypothetical protein [Sinorhizobium meliloti]MDE3767578.1 phosphoglycerate kinase [Sinorhizobium meliloti]MDE3779792.1 phosphoglycerate kinase [Sinorhizobium meliloti]MDE3807417.1 phosphoglycerate kinase [Sinorhizobium meliloti]